MKLSNTSIVATVSIIVNYSVFIIIHVCSIMFFLIITFADATNAVSLKTRSQLRLKYETKVPG